MGVSFQRRDVQGWQWPAEEMGRAGGAEPLGPVLVGLLGPAGTPWGSTGPSLLTAQEPWGVGARVWTRGRVEEPPGAGVWWTVGEQREGQGAAPGPPPWWCSCGPGATPSHTILRGCSHGFIPNRNTCWETVCPAAGLGRNLMPTSVIFLIYEGTKPEPFLLYCKQIQVSCLDVLQKSPIIMNI